MTERRETYTAMVVRSTSEFELATLPRDALADDAVRVAVAAAGVNPVDAGNRADGTWAGLDASYVVGYDESLGVAVVVDRHLAEPLRAARERVGVDFPMAADLVSGGLLAASPPLMADGGRAAAIVDLTGDLDEALDRNITVHGVLLRPGRELLESRGRLVERGVLWRPLAEAARALRRVQSGSGQGKVVLSVPTLA